MWLRTSALFHTALVGPRVGQVENTESGNGNGNGNSEKIVRSKSIYCQSRWKFDASVLVR